MLARRSAIILASWCSPSLTIARLNQRRWYPTFSSTNTFRDVSTASQTRPDLFYHLVGPPNPLSSEHPAFAISFLSAAPPNADSCTIIGWLPTASAADSEAGLNDFVENRKFRAVLHEAIKTGIVEDVDDIQMARAVQTYSGWMHINDDRNVPALGRINDPDDIFASVLVEDGKILSDTYQAMPSYRLCTADGLPQLTPGLAQKLRTLLEQRAREETDG